MRQGDPSNFDANCMDQARPIASSPLPLAPANPPGSAQSRAARSPQALLNDALNSAALPDGSAYDWPSVYNEERNGKHPFWHDEKRRGEKSKRGPGQPVRDCVIL